MGVPGLRVVVGLLLLAAALTPLFYRYTVHGAVWSHETRMVLVESNLTARAGRVEALRLLYLECRPGGCNGVGDALVEPLKPGSRVVLNDSLLLNMFAVLRPAGELTPTVLYYPDPTRLVAEWRYYTVSGRAVFRVGYRGVVAYVNGSCPRAPLPRLVAVFERVPGGCIVEPRGGGLTPFLEVVVRPEYGTAGRLEASLAPSPVGRLVLGLLGLAALLWPRLRGRVPHVLFNVIIL